MPEAKCEFEVTRWDSEPWDEPDEGPVLARIAVDKQMTGAIDGNSSAELVIAQGEGGEAYSAIDRFEGIVDGLAGSFVLHHGGTRAPDMDAISFGHIVRGSGTGELAGITGTAEFQHDDNGAILTLRYELPAAAES